MYKIKFYGQNATSGKMGTVEMPSGKKQALPKNVYKRDGFKFMGWAVKRDGVIDMNHLQINKVKYKNKQEVKDLAKDGETIKLYACWKGYGAAAAAKWARLICKDNSFTYGVGERAHHCGCYFCGTTRTGIKKAKKGSSWEKTYGCNPFVYACLTHGANLFKTCRNSSLKAAWWCKLEVAGQRIYKKLGKNVKYSDLKPGDILIKEQRHVKIYVGKNKKGKHQVAHAAGEGWGSKTIRVDNVSGRIGTDYMALRYIGR